RNTRRLVMDARAITKALGGKWQRDYGLCHRPLHADRTPSLKVRDDARKSDGRAAHCFAGCAWEDGKGTLTRQRLLPEFARGCARSTAPRAPIVPLVGLDDEEQRVAFALKIWEASKPLRSLAKTGTGHNETLGWKYFVEQRGLDIGTLDDFSHALR